MSARTAVAPIRHAKARTARATVTGAGGPRSQRQPRQQQSTPLQVRRLLIVLLAATAALWVTAAVLQRGLQATAGGVRDTASPAYLDAAAASAALSDADRAAWQSFRSGEAQFSGPGQQYQNDITTAGQALERLAALDASNSADSSLLQTISGQLVNYEGLVEEADAEYRRDIALGADSKDDLGFAYLAYASSAMRDPQGGLLASIGQLVRPGQRVLSSQMASSWADPALLLILAVPGLALIAGLAVAQAFVQRRFRRLISPPLLLATALTIILSAWLVTTTVKADAAFASARSTALPAVTGLWQTQTKAVNAEAAALQSGSAGAVSDQQAGGLNAAATAKASSTLDGDLVAADDFQGLTVGLPALALVIGALIFVGLRPRLIEYRGISDGY